MTLPRKVAAERLDGLAPEDPQAQGSRRDLIRINGLRRAPGIMSNLLAPHRFERILEIGAGDGGLMLSVARRLAPQNPGPCVTLLDRHTLLPGAGKAAYGRAGWGCETIAADVFEYLGSRGSERFDAITTNLFLHHFEDDRLAELLRLVAAKTDLFVACEPRRSTFSLAGSGMLWAIGCNGVTRYDARVSVLAGFREGEITALWPDPLGWTLQERMAAPFSHTFKAERKR